MYRAPIPWNARVKPEERICIEFADSLRAATLAGELKCIFCHVPNEGKRHIFVALILRAMGMITGCADYFFAWESGSGFIEFKTPGNKQTPSQKDFEQWCVDLGIKYAVCTSAAEATKKLEEWKILIK